uniref:G-protein coupled receptors family 1 profile domain-containing protein n=1 Tax=Phlebotomus papatasi TaxID=29031 RepID=A0A1B0D0N6_PHLPP
MKHVQIELKYLHIQVKRFRMETKAAKTLAIIVGLFILCWLPFFTVYVIRAFCADCVHPVLFSVIFWLGYCNSAVNPMIYALFSKDFRFAFKRIICRCFCAGPGPNTATSRRGSDMSQVKVRTPSISPSANAQSINDDSDPIVELSDSRKNAVYEICHPLVMETPTYGYNPGGAITTTPAPGQQITQNL